MKKQRFILIDDLPDEFPITDDTWWWWDTDRPFLPEGKPYVGKPFIAKQTDKEKGDPNNFVRHENMALLFTDQAEYYAVCQRCRSIYAHMQWSGSTSAPNWRQRSQQYLRDHIAQKGWCEFCDRFFGNGGWIL